MPITLDNNHSITDNFISSDEYNDIMVSTSIKLITISLNSNSDLVYTKVEKARNSLAENLGEIWQFNTQQVSEVLNDTLTEIEQDTLQQLDEFDFGDI